MVTTTMPDHFDFLFPFGVIQVVEEVQVFDYDPSVISTASLPATPSLTPPALVDKASKHDRRHVTPQNLAQQRRIRARRAALAQIMSSSDSEMVEEPRQPRRRPRRRTSPSSSSSTTGRRRTQCSAGNQCTHTPRHGLIASSESPGLSSGTLSTSLFIPDDDDRDLRRSRDSKRNRPMNSLRHFHTAPEVSTVAAAAAAAAAASTSATSPPLRRCNALGEDQFLRACLPSVTRDNGTLNRIASADIGQVQLVTSSRPPSTPDQIRQAFTPAQSNVAIPPRRRRRHADRSYAATFDSFQIQQQSRRTQHPVETSKR